MPVRLPPELSVTAHQHTVQRAAGSFPPHFLTSRCFLQWMCTVSVEFVPTLPPPKPGAQPVFRWGFLHEGMEVTLVLLRWPELLTGPGDRVCLPAQGPVLGLPGSRCSRQNTHGDGDTGTEGFTAGPARAQAPPPELQQECLQRL